MGTLTITVTDPTDGTVAKAFTVPDAHITRWVAAHQVEANASINGTATRLQVLNYIANKTMQGWKDTVQGYETANAVTAAAGGVTPITAT